MYQNMTGTVFISNETSGIFNVKTNAVHVYPNPVKETLTVIFNQPISNDGVIEIWNILGNRVLTNTISKASIEQKIDVSNLSSGIYSYLIKINNTKIISDKIAIIK